MKKIDISGTAPKPTRDKTEASEPSETASLPTVIGARELARGRNLIEISEKIDQERREHLWTDAIACARDVALACLPRKRTDEKIVKKTIAFAPDCRVTVKYSVPEDCQMPFGADRFVFFGVQHLARISNSPLVEFQKAGHLLDMFGLSDSGAEYRRLRARFQRLRSLNIAIETWRDGRGTGSGAQWGIGSRFIEEWSLPSKKAVEAELSGQETLWTGRSPYFVKLADSLFSRVQKNNPQENILLLRLDLLKHFRDCPIGWDYCVFLLHRCGSARKTSVVPHDVLMEFFKAGNEPDRLTIDRLQGYHKEIKCATGDSLNAELVVVREERKGRGRPRKVWGLRVGPSQSVVLSGDFSRRRLKD